MKITKWVMMGLLLIVEGIGAWHVFGRFERAPVADASFPDYASVLLPAVLFTWALEVISPRPLRFVLLIFLTGFGAFLLFVIGLWGIDRIWAGELGKPGLFVVNLGLAAVASIPLFAMLAGFHRDGLQAVGVSLIYGGLCSLGYKLQYGPQIQPLQWELVPLWGSWIGILAWYLFVRGPYGRKAVVIRRRFPHRGCVFGCVKRSVPIDPNRE